MTVQKKKGRKGNEMCMFRQSESREEYDERRRNGTNISLSEIYVRNNTDQLTDSTTLMQAQLPFEELRTEESSTLSAGLLVGAGVGGGAFSSAAR